MKKLFALVLACALLLSMAVVSTALAVFAERLGTRLLDGMMEGSPSFGQASTIIDCTGKEIRILRPGPVTMNDIEQVLKQ